MERLCDKKIGEKVLIFVETPYTPPNGGIFIEKELNAKEVEHLSNIKRVFLHVKENNALVFVSIDSIPNIIKHGGCDVIETRCLLKLYHQKGGKIYYMNNEQKVI